MRGPIDVRVSAFEVSSDEADLVGLRALLALRDLELDPLVLLQAAVAAGLDRGEVHEHVGATPVLADETGALVGVAPLRGSLWHCCSPLSGEALLVQARSRLGLAAPHRPRRRRENPWSTVRDNANHLPKNPDYASKVAAVFLADPIDCRSAAAGRTRPARRGPGRPGRPPGPAHSTAENAVRFPDPISTGRGRSRFSGSRATAADATARPCCDRRVPPRPPIVALSNARHGPPQLVPRPPPASFAPAGSAGTTRP